MVTSVYAQAIANAASAVSSSTDGPFTAATLTWPGAPTWTAGGDIDTPGTPVEANCIAQVSAPDTKMRAEEGFVERDMRVLIPAASLAGDAPDTTARIVIAGGNHPGTYSLESVAGDSAGAGFVCRARPS